MRLKTGVGQEGRETGGRLPGCGLRCVGRSQYALRPNPGGRGMVRGPGQQVKRQHDKTVRACTPLQPVPTHTCLLFRKEKWGDTTARPLIQSQKLFCRPWLWIKGSFPVGLYFDPTHSLSQAGGEFYCKTPFGNHPRAEHRRSSIQTRSLEHWRLCVIRDKLMERRPSCFQGLFDVCTRFHCSRFSGNTWGFQSAQANGVRCTVA